MSTHIVFATLVTGALLSSCSSPSDVGPGQCHPCTVSKEVGPLLKEAQTLIAAKDFKAAQAKLDEAEAVKSDAVDDQIVINQFRRAIELCENDNKCPTQP